MSSLDGDRPGVFDWAGSQNSPDIALAYSCLPNTELSLLIQLWNENLKYVDGLDRAAHTVQ